jgi:hypothetical protein
MNLFDPKPGHDPAVADRLERWARELLGPGEHFFHRVQLGQRQVQLATPSLGGTTFGQRPGVGRDAGQAGLAPGPGAA